MPLIKYSNVKATFHSGEGRDWKQLDYGAVPFYKFLDSVYQYLI